MREVRVGRPVTVGEMTIIPLETISVCHRSKRDRFAVYASKEPVGIVIRTPQSKYAFDIRGIQVPLETYTQEFDGLQEILDGL